MIISSYLKILYKLYPKGAIKVVVNLFSKPFSPKKRKRTYSIFQRATILNETYKGKTVVTYQWGSGDNATLVIHGWGGRAGNFERMINVLVKEGNTVYAFDAPAHGNSAGKHTHVLEFRDVAMELIRKNSQIKHIVGHSLGGVAAVLALKELEKEPGNYGLVLISAPTDLLELFNKFIRFFKLPNQAYIDGMQYIQDKVGLDLAKASLMYMESPLNTTEITIMHDKDDTQVQLVNSERIIRNWKIHPEHILITNSLGHYKILSDAHIIKRIQEEVSLSDHVNGLA